MPLGRGRLYSVNQIEYEAKRWTMKRWMDRLKLDPPRLFDVGEPDWMDERVRDAFSEMWDLKAVGVVSEDSGPNVGYSYGFRSGFLGLGYVLGHMAEDGSQRGGSTLHMSPWNIMAIYELPDGFQQYKHDDEIEEWVA